MSKKEIKHVVSFDDAHSLRLLFGPDFSHLRQIEKKLDIKIHVRGGELSIQGKKEPVLVATQLLTEAYSLLRKDFPISAFDIDRGLSLLIEDPKATLSSLFEHSIPIPFSKKTFFPRTPNQKEYVRGMQEHDITFGIVPAGTGKTYLATAMAVSHLLKGKVRKIVLTRPAIEAGERLGFLPGTLEEKVNPYLRPLYDALNEMLDFDRTQKMIHRGDIEIAPLAFMRGRTLNESFIILDEAQNCTTEQMKMFLTRIGLSSKAVITGDVTQIDLPKDKQSGLIQSLEVLKGVPAIYQHFFTDRDVVRHPLVAEIVKAYAAYES